MVQCRMRAYNHITVNDIDEMRGNFFPCENCCNVNKLEQWVSKGSSVVVRCGGMCSLENERKKIKLMWLVGTPAASVVL